jgi:ubiquinone/menaquinone biosynthesis C-methylase UbiE
MSQATLDLTDLKARMKATWMAGDFGRVAQYIATSASEFVDGLGIPAGVRVLDVACGTGNTAIPAARAGAEVIGVDIATNLIEQARKRAASEGVNAMFEEGDAENLAFPDDSFDYVITMYGAMFAPRPEVVASELLRVCKAGGEVVMANWTPRGFIGQQFRIMAQRVPPPPAIPAPILWGDEDVVRQRFAHGVSHLALISRKVMFRYPFPPKDVVQFFRTYFGPTQTAFARLDADGKAALAAELAAHMEEHNLATDGTTMVEGEYLEVRARKA